MQPTRAVNKFEVISEYVPSGDQPQAIRELAARINAGETDVVIDNDGAIEQTMQQVDALWAKAQHAVGGRT